MKGLLASASILGTALIATVLSRSLDTDAASPIAGLNELPDRVYPDGSPRPIAATRAPTSSRSETVPAGLGGVVPPLVLSAPSSLDAPWQRPRAHSEPHGHQTCASGCAASHHPTPRLTKEHCRDLLAAYQQEPIDHESDALDELLYFGAQTRFQLRDESLRKLLDAKHLMLLNRELSRERAIVSIRLLDQYGKVRAECPATEVPQHVRQVFECDVDDLQPLVCSGTVKRVGKNHIWQRL